MNEGDDILLTSNTPFLYHSPVVCFAAKATTLPWVLRWIQSYILHFCLVSANINAYHQPSIASPHPPPRYPFNHIIPFHIRRTTTTTTHRTEQEKKTEQNEIVLTFLGGQSFCLLSDHFLQKYFYTLFVIIFGCGVPRPWYREQAAPPKWKENCVWMNADGVGGKELYILL